MTHQPDPNAEIRTILETLRAEVRARRLRHADAVDDALMHELRRSLDDIELQRVVSAHWPLVGRSLPERALMFVHKVVRRGLRWYINPIVEQQNAYNAAVAQTVRLLGEAYEDLSRRIAEHGHDDDPGDSGGSGSHASASAAPPAAPTDQPTAQAWVREQGLREPPARFPDLALQTQIAQLRLRQDVTTHWLIEGRRPLEQVAALVQKLVRRYLRWLINPIVEQQNAANAAMTAAIVAAIRLDADRRARAAGRSDGKQASQNGSAISS